jgi:peptidoglycan/LPS O-acetylase OafA/YrhL
MADLPLPRSPRYLSLDFWRGVACLMVVVFHASYYVRAEEEPAPFNSIFRGISYLWLGVPMFFVISGYCISAASDAARRKPRSVGYYFFRRFRRIFPPYWIAVGLTVVVVTIFTLAGRPDLFHDGWHDFPRPAWLSPIEWIGNLSLTEGWRGHLMGAEGVWFFGHAWSLGYEEQFYALCGLILFTMPRRFFTGMILITLLAGLLRGASSLLGFPRSGLFFDGYWLLFAAGSLVYYNVNYAGLTGQRIGAALLGLLLAASALFLLQTRADFAVSLVVCFAFALLLFALHKRDEAIHTSPWTRPVTFCGVMCYSLYLVHWPVTKAVSHGLYLAGVKGGMLTLLVTIPSCVAASVAVARAFHVLVERRFLNTPPNTTIKNTRSENAA